MMKGVTDSVETCTGKVLHTGKSKNPKPMPKSSTRVVDKPTVVQMEPEYSFPASWKGRIVHFSSNVGEYIDGYISTEWRDRIATTKQLVETHATDMILTDNVQCLIESELEKQYRLLSVQELAYIIYRPTETSLANHYFNQKFRRALDLGRVKNAFCAKEAQNGYVSLDYLLEEIKPLSMKALWTKLIQVQLDPSYAHSVVAKKFFSTYLVYTILVECVNRYGFFPSREFLVGIYSGILDKKLNVKGGEIPDKMLTIGNFKTKLGGSNPGLHVAHILNLLCDAEILEMIENTFNKKLNWYEFSDRSYICQDRQRRSRKSLSESGGGPVKVIMCNKLVPGEVA